MNQQPRSAADGPVDASRYELAIQVGEEANRQGKWEQALACFRSARDGLPKDARVHDGLGDAYRGLGQMKRARNSYEQAARLDPEEPAYVVKIAELRREEGDIDVAVQATLMAGDIYWRQGRDAQAMELWQEAARLKPGAPGIEERMANWNIRNGNTGEAIRHYLALVDSLRAQGRRLAALHVCTMALRLAPDDEEMRKTTEDAWRAAASRNSGSNRPADSVSASDLVTAANDLAQWQLTSVFRAGMVNRGERTPEEVERNTHLGQGLLHEAGGLAGAAIGEYEKALAAGLRLPAMFFVLGLLYRLVGRQAGAQAALTLAAQDPFYEQAVTLLDR